MIDFNQVEETQLIPHGTVARARLTLKLGDDPENQYLRISRSGNKYLDCEFVILESQYAKRKVFHKIGIDGNLIGVQMGQRFIKNLLESAAGVGRFDHSEAAEKTRMLNDFADLDGIEVTIKIGIEPAGEFQPKNNVIGVVTADSPEFKMTALNDDIPW